MENNTLNGLLGAASKVQKKWDEQSDSEKVENLRQEMLNGRYLISRVVKLENELRKLRQHDHVNGKVVIEAKEEHDYSGAVMAFDNLR